MVLTITNKQNYVFRRQCARIRTANWKKEDQYCFKCEKLWDHFLLLFHLEMNPFKHSHMNSDQKRTYCDCLKKELVLLFLHLRRKLLEQMITDCITLFSGYLMLICALVVYNQPNISTKKNWWVDSVDYRARYIKSDCQQVLRSKINLYSCFCCQMSE